MSDHEERIKLAEKLRDLSEFLAIVGEDTMETLSGSPENLPTCREWMEYDESVTDVGKSLADGLQGALMYHHLLRGVEGLKAHIEVTTRASLTSDESVAGDLGQHWVESSRARQWLMRLIYSLDYNIMLTMEMCWVETLTDEDRVRLASEMQTVFVAFARQYRTLLGGETVSIASMGEESEFETLLSLTLEFRFPGDHEAQSLWRDRLEAEINA